MDPGRVQRRLDVPRVHRELLACIGEGGIFVSEPDDFLEGDVRRRWAIAWLGDRQQFDQTRPDEPVKRTPAHAHHMESLMEG